MFPTNRICKLFSIQYPIIQAGMVWCSGWKLATAVSNSGGLGLIGAGSMSPDILREHITKAKENAGKPFGVNIPLLGDNIEDKIKVLLEEKIKIIFSSAGNPSTWTLTFKEKGCVVVHVVSSIKNAKKAIDAGVDALVAEGFEAGGHNGREETTSMVLIPTIRSVTTLPLIAAGGMYSGRSLFAAMALGADAIQVGSRFAIARESSAHENYKRKVIEINEGDTRLIMKKLIPVRLIKNKFFSRIVNAEESGASRKEILEILGFGRSRKGIFEGDLEEGELEIGQISCMLKETESAKKIINEIVEEYFKVKKQLLQT